MKETAYQIVGGKSLRYELEEYQKVFPRMPESNVRVVEDAGHWVHFDKPLETI